MIGGYYEDKLKNDLIEIARREGKTLSQLAEEIFKECIARRKSNKKQKS